MGKTKTKQSSRKKKEIGEQVPTRDCKEALVNIGSPEKAVAAKNSQGSSRLLRMMAPRRLINFIKKISFSQ